jgi:HlyD family type I secretion membrane fusion protein
VATLQRAQEQSALQELRARIAGLAARQQRLTAEQLDRNDLAISIDTLPKSVEGLEATLIDYLINDQMTEFRDRRTQLSDTLGVLLAQRRAFEEQMLGSQGQLDALNGQLSSLSTDVELRRTAIKEGFGRESALREMERQEGSARGEIAKMNSTLAALRHQINEIDQRIGSTRSQFKEKVSNELSKTRSELIEAIETLAGKAETAARVDIRAPVTGVVKTLHVNTIGSAVEPYRPLLEIVPEGRPLLIEAHIQPTDVDNVFPQQKAKVVLSAFNRHLFDPADAHVEFVAADATKDEATGQSYFVVRLAVDATNDKPLPPIVPGMPAEAYLVTGDRTFAEYIAEPFVQSFQRAFRQ